jgi:hypothetical protein
LISCQRGDGFLLVVGAKSNGRWTAGGRSTGSGLWVIEAVSCLAVGDGSCLVSHGLPIVVSFRLLSFLFSCVR